MSGARFGTIKSESVRKVRVSQCGLRVLCNNDFLPVFGLVGRGFLILERLTSVSACLNVKRNVKFGFFARTE